MKITVVYVIVLVCVLLFAGLTLLFAVAGGFWYYKEYATTTTTTTTTTSSTMTSSTTTTTTTTTTTSSTSTTTLTSFYVCEKTVEDTVMAETRCYGKIGREYRNYTIKAEVTYKITNPSQQPYDDWRVKVNEDTCNYVSQKVSITVGSMATCEIPRNLTHTIPAKLVIIR